MNFTESTWKCMTTQKLLLAWKAAVNFFKKCANSSGLYATNAAIYDQLNADILFRRGNDLYLPTFTCPLPCFNMNGSEWGLKMQSKIK